MVKRSLSLVSRARKFSVIVLWLSASLEDIFPPRPAEATKTNEATGT